jgi:hypothetical protein
MFCRVKSAVHFWFVQVLIMRVDQYVAMVDRKLSDEEIGRCAPEATQQSIASSV